MTRNPPLYLVDRGDRFRAAFDSAVAEGSARMAAAAADQQGWARQTYVALGALLELLVDGWPGARVVLVEAQGAGTAGVARYEKLGSTAAAWLSRARAQYPAAAELPDCFERMVVDGVAFLLRQSLLDSAELAMPELLHELALYILEPFVGPTEFRRLEAEIGNGKVG